ncbi:MAG: protein kinase [bacterium]|nr:protein kinase [bacterium]
MSTRAGCPDPAKLEEYAQDNLAREETASLDQHLADCPACLERYVGLGRRSLVPDISNCHVVKEIGRGRFGAVYKAWSLGTRPRIVALKVLICPGEMERDRFDREIAALKTIDSPWIVRCLQSGETGDAKYFVMDFVEGLQFNDYCASSPRDLNSRLRVFQRVCRAVADAHAKGVIHRDLKPSNILIDAHDQPHIIDFGICGVDAADWSSWKRRTITHPGDVIGTLKYMSPEQAWGGIAGPIDERSDIWSLGVLLYELVTDGDYPYSLHSTGDRPAHEDLLERIRKELPRLPRLGSVPRGRDLEVLLERCLAWEPGRRVESAAKLADDLERYCAGQRIKTRPLRLPYRLKRLAVGAAARSRWIFWALFVAAVAVALWVTAFLFRVGWYLPTYQPHRLGAGAPGLVAADQTHRGILVVGVGDDTVNAVVEFAAQRGIDGVSASVPTWRAVHGYLMERLARARPRAVVWGYFFRTAQPGDARLVAGLRELEQNGIPVVLAASTYRPDGSPDLSSGLLGPLGDDLRHGAIDARDMVQRPGEFVMAARIGKGVVTSSLALATLAALLHPDARLDLDWPDGSRYINLLYQSQPGAYLRERDRVELTKVFKAGDHQSVFAPDDLLACNQFPLQKPEQWERRMVPYHALLACRDDELQALVNNKLIIIGDLRTRRQDFLPDRHRVKYGLSIVNDVPGCYLLADAIAGLLDRRYMKSAIPLPATTFLSMLLVAAIGCLLPVNLAARAALEQPGRRRAIWLAVLGLSAASFLVMVVAKNWATVHLGMAGFCLLAAMAGSFWVEFTRNRHRTLDRDRRAVEDVGLAARGTVTVTSEGH